MKIEKVISQSIEKARVGDLYPLSNLIDHIRYKGIDGKKYDYQAMINIFDMFDCKQDEFEMFLEKMDNIESTGRYSNAKRY